MIESLIHLIDHDPIIGTLIILPVVFIISYLLWMILMRARNKIGPFKHIVNALAFVGVIVHEFSHFLLCKLLGVPTDGIRIKLLDETTRRVSPHGSVSLRNDKNLSFMQNFLIAFAPLFISTWLFFESLTIFLTPSFDDFIRVVAAFFCASLLMGAAPSHPDLVIMASSFKTDTRYSLYQIFLAFLSGISVWLAIAYFNIVFPFDFLYFIVIGITYCVFYFLFKGVNRLFHTSYSVRAKTSGRVKLGPFTRRRFKPAKPHKLGIEEPHW